MWYLTERKNGELVRTAEFQFVNIERALRLYKSIGYTEDELLTVPEWGRYYLQKSNSTGTIYQEVILEKEED